ncbi:MAG TPA: arylsulfotransferase family protein [Polyangiaceae bacterium]
MRPSLFVSCFTLTCLAFACTETTGSPEDGAAGSTTSGGATSHPAAGAAGSAAGSAASAGSAATRTGEGGSAPVEAAAGASGADIGADIGAAGTGGSAPIEANAGDGGSAPLEAAAGASETDTSILPVSAQGGVLSLELSPLTLTPTFSPAIHDYYVRCVAGQNDVTLTTTDVSGPRSSALSMVPDQAIVVGGSYWVRCLPPDFPVITVTEPGTPTPGYYLLNSAAYGGVFDSNGVPVWYARGTMPINVESPAPNTISFMRNANAGAAAFYEIHDLATNTVTKVMAPDTPTDDHEMRILPNGDFLVFTYPLQPGIDLTGLKAYTSSDTLIGCNIEELDPAGNIVWSWLATDHVDPVLESLTQIGAQIDGTAGVDAFHCNGIDVDSTGNLLVSMRHTSSVFYIERASSKILWKLGGTAFNKDGATLIQTANDSEGTFSQQHDARFQANGNISLYDDHGLGTGFARGIEYALDLDAKTATPVFQFLGSGIAFYEGSFRRYADGESLISWGYVPSDPRVLTEIDSAGNDVFDIAFSGPNVSYRGEKVALAQFDLDLLRRNAAH